MIYRETYAYDDWANGIPCYACTECEDHGGPERATRWKGYSLRCDQCGSRELLARDAREFYRRRWVSRQLRKGRVRVYRGDGPPVFMQRGKL